MLNVTMFPNRASEDRCCMWQFWRVNTCIRWDLKCGSYCWSAISRSISYTSADHLACTGMVTCVVVVEP